MIANIKNEPFLVIVSALLLLMGVVSLNSVAPQIFPQYYLYVFASIFVFVIFSQIHFDILRAFSSHLYVGSILFLLLPLILGQITRGTVRWIEIGNVTLQPAELTRPFLFLFIAGFLAGNGLTAKKFVKAFGLMFLPVMLIFLQPSLGVSVLTGLGFVGIFITLPFDKRALLLAAVFAILLMPLSWFFLAPYQKDRILAITKPDSDPQGIGYNSIQSLITVGSGGLTGRGLGEGVQTQLMFLPERETDFIFASISEEMGFLGSFFVVLLYMLLLYRITTIAGNAQSVVGRSFTAGVFLSLFAQIFVHLAMNMGLLPITGLPLPLVSMGGSSLLSTSVSLGMLVSIKKKR